VLTTAREYLPFEKEDPWRDYGKGRRSLAAAGKLLNLNLAFRRGDEQRLAPVAATYVRASIERLSLVDPTFAVLQAKIVQEIVDRLPDAIPVGRPFSGRTFQRSRGMMETVPLFEPC
jgi:hypothetical protein